MDVASGQETVDDAMHASSRLATRVESQLFVALECDRPLAGAARYSLAGVHEVIIGRGDARSSERATRNGLVTLTLRLPARSLSSVHARFLRSQGQWIIEDARSRNGSFVNGERVTRRAVNESDIIDCGHTILLLRESAIVSSDTPVDVDTGTDRTSTEGGAIQTLNPIFAEQLVRLRKVAASKVPVLLLGETGTGKEVLARLVHSASHRAGRFAALNCGALPTPLVEAQLFGHVRGAFSGAARDELGFVRSADNGTLLLDEIGELAPASQTALLRVLQESEVTPVGSTSPIKVDVRFVAATNRILDEDIATDRFRADLLGRLAGFTMVLPPLRERREDIGILVRDLLNALAGADASKLTITTGAGRALFRHRWPLNVRELRQVLATAIALSTNGVLDESQLPQSFGTAPAPRPVELETDELSDEDARLRGVLLSHLHTHAGNVTAVGRALGKAPAQIHRWMKRFGIDPGAFRA